MFRLQRDREKKRHIQGNKNNQGSFYSQQAVFKRVVLRRPLAFTSHQNGSSKVVYRFPTVNLSQAASQCCLVAINSRIIGDSVGESLAAQTRALLVKGFLEP